MTILRRVGPSGLLAAAAHTAISSAVAHRLQQLGSMHPQRLLTADDFTFAKNPLLHE
ncbi:hypothetical protein [Microbacterium sp. Leaf161]|uniref:hypothetical protein n=1 Tax=Microbacterium sp. Leaf161 TaxID=1736281 RepID=UPI000AC0F665|nr:hypothetical protein [Microbacterium sp. Leaf161]